MRLADAKAGSVRVLRRSHGGAAVLLRGALRGGVSAMGSAAAGAPAGSRVMPDLMPDGPLAGLPRGHFGLLLADPPWRFVTYSTKGLTKSPQAHYACMDLTAIRALPVADLAAPDCALVMWATAPLLPAALDTMEAWGFRYKSAGAWAKQSSTGRRWAFGTGYAYRSAAEFFLLGTRGKPRQQVRDRRNLIVAPIREHSRKPDQMRVDLEALWPGPRLELFAREPAPGWTAWGNEVNRFADGLSDDVAELDSEPP